MTLDEVLAVARLGAEQGCTEALFTLGDKPELLYPEAAAELAEMGYASTLDYVEAAAAAVMRETGLLPHINAGEAWRWWWRLLQGRGLEWHGWQPRDERHALAAGPLCAGVMGREGLRRLKAVSASQGLMLESTSPALLLPGGAHHDCPDKVCASMEGQSPASLYSLGENFGRQICRGNGWLLHPPCLDMACRRCLPAGPGCAAGHTGGCWPGGCPLHNRHPHWCVLQPAVGTMRSLARVRSSRAPAGSNPAKSCLPACSVPACRHW